MHYSAIILLVVASFAKYLYFASAFTSSMQSLSLSMLRSAKLARTEVLLRNFHSMKPLNLNRLFVQESECSTNANGDIKCTLLPNDTRFTHISEILKMNEGDCLRCGIADVGMTNAAVIEQRSDKNGITIKLGQKSQLYTNTRPSIDLILAVPRPLRLERLVPIIASMGVGKLVLIQANKVLKDYFGSQLFRPSKLTFRGLMTEGLSQAEVDCNLPIIHVQRRMSTFLEKDIDELFPEDEYNRFIAQPVLRPLEGREYPTYTSKRLFQYDDLPRKPRTVIAIGPESGWEMDEITCFVEKKFHVINLGDRILRTDCAVPSLLAVAHEWMAMRGDNTNRSE